MPHNNSMKRVIFLDFDGVLNTGKYQNQLKKGNLKVSDIEWGFIRKMTDVIQEPIIRRRLKEVQEWRKDYVDIES